MVWHVGRSFTFSNAPFARPDAAHPAKGLKFIRDNGYSTRGRLAA